MRTIVRGRAWGGGLALGGAVLAVPAIIWPTQRLSMGPVGDGPGVPDVSARFVQLTWSWGRYAMEGADVPPDVGQANILGLVFYVCTVVVGLAAAALWLTRRGSSGRVLGVAGTAILGAALGRGLAERIGQQLAEFYGGPDGGMTVQTTPAGVLEACAVAVLASAVLVMLWRPLLVTSASTWTSVVGWARDARARDAAAEVESIEETRGTIVLHGGRSSDATLPGSGDQADSAGIDFTDLRGDDDRFRPPRS